MVASACLSGPGPRAASKFEVNTNQRVLQVTCHRKINDNSILTHLKLSKLQPYIMPSAKEIGACLNDSTRENLFANLSAVHSDNSLLITTREVSKLLNYLTPFLALRAKGGLEKTLLIDDVTSVEEFRSMCSAYKAFTVIMAGNDDGISHLKRLWSVLDHKQSATINLIIKDFGKAFYDLLLLDVLFLKNNTVEQFSSFDTRFCIFAEYGSWRATGVP